MIEIRNVSLRLDGKSILNNISLTLEPGKIYGLVGSNGSGKTMLMKCICGFVHPTEGEIKTDGRRVGKDVDYLPNAGIIIETPGFIPYYSGLQNLRLLAGIRRKVTDDQIRKALKITGLDPDSRLPVRKYSLGMRQRLGIAQAIMEQPDILILDEPTSSLDEQEVTKLFGLMRDLKARGVGIIFVTHFLDQVYEVCDKITVMRDGSLVGEYAIKDLPRVQLVSKMLGKELDDLSDIKGEQPTEQKTENGEPLFETKDLCSDAGIKPFDFYIKKGEVNGFTGLLGSGRSECVRAIFGADRVIGGTVKKNGKQVKINKPLDAMRCGIGYLPEDRKRDGIVGDLSVRENIILALQVLRGFFHPISKAEANKFADEYIKLLDIKTASAETPIKSLSGGNQQKVILARWLLTHPEYLILDEPTRGIDVGTKVDIQKLVLKLASEGMSVTFISSETDEMLRTCSRLVVMRDRKVVGELSGEDLTQTKIMSTIAGGESKHE